MGIFSASNPFDAHVDRATSEKNTSDDWAQIMDVCDRVKEDSNGPKDCLKAIAKRLASDNPRVALQSITLLDACINNCGRKFLLEVAGREFEQELSKCITSSRTHPKVSARLKESLKTWAEGEFKGDPELGLITALYTKLHRDGVDFNADENSPKKTPATYSNDPNVVNSQQEEEDIAKAIQLSLQEKESNSYSSPRASSGYSSNLYSSASSALRSTDAVSGYPTKNEVKVRALYDFEAAEDNELSFKSGEIIIIIDDSDANWWKGTNHRGEGLFPANFVTKDLNEPVGAAQWSNAAGSKHVSFSDCVEVTEVEQSNLEEASSEPPTGDVDEATIDRLLHLLHEADPTGERSDDPALSMLEEQVNAMAPNIDIELESIDRRHAQLARISTDLMDSLNLYHQLMREMPISASSYYSPYKGITPPTGVTGSGLLQSSPYNVNNSHQMAPQPLHSGVQYGSFGGVMHQPEMSAVYGGSPAVRPVTASVGGDSMTNVCSVPQPGAPPSYPVLPPNSEMAFPHMMPGMHPFQSHSLPVSDYNTGVPSTLGNADSTSSHVVPPLQSSEASFVPPVSYGPGSISYPPSSLSQGSQVGIVYHPNQGIPIAAPNFPSGAQGLPHPQQGSLITSSYPVQSMAHFPHGQSLPPAVSSIHQPIQ